MTYPFCSLRDWIKFLEEKGDLVQNNEKVNIEGDIAAISRRIAKAEGPAVIHNNIEDYPGWRVFSDGLTTRKRQLSALNIEAPKAVQLMGEKLEKSKPVKPVKVDDAPCKAVKIFGDEIDLTKLPVSFTGEYQTTPHITAGISFIKDPGTGWTNAGIRRFQVMGKNQLCNLILPYQHEGMIFSEYKNRKKPMPISIVIGADPIVYFCCMFPAPDQFDEMGYWGIFAGEPLKVVKCETNDILVPASAEVVIEGEIDLEERKLEGPFPEFPGYYSGFRMLPVIKVNAITMRNDPIYQEMPMGVPPSEGHSVGAFIYGIELFRQLRPLIPAVADVGILSTWSMTTAISLDKRARMRTPGLERKLALAVKAVRAGAIIKNLFIVDDDVDVHNIHEVLWSFSVKFQAARDIIVLEDLPGAFLDPSEMWVGHGGKYSGHTSAGIFICTEKPAPYDEGYKRGLALPARESSEKVDQNWTKYGFK